MPPAEDRGWLLLIHQIPPKPAYLRAKIGRRLQQIGAVPVKNSVYVLPAGASSHEDFQWVSGEIVQGGGEATVCRAQFVDGLTDETVRRMFNSARDEDYRRLVQDADGGQDLERLRQRLAEIREIDFFGARGRGAAETALRRLAGKPSTGPEKSIASLGAVRGKTWVTRQGIHVDRIASAWLIRGFIDPRARFKFVPGRTCDPKKGTFRFDMADGEFTHEGEDCSFETLLNRFGLREPALRRIAEIVHDIDLKDRKFRCEEAPGVDRLIAGICMAEKTDEERLRRGSSVFDALFEYFKRKGG
jgi:hypothetical protein